MKSLMLLGVLFIGMLSSCSDVDRDDPSGLIANWRNGSSLSSSSADNLIFDSRDGSLYKTVVIGSQTWLAQNINYGTMVLDVDGQVNDGLVEKYCYGDLDYNCSTDGGLYTWAEAMNLPSYCNSESCFSQISSVNHQGICPSGWHIPSADEIFTFILNLGENLATTLKLNNTGYSDWDATTFNDGNSSGFSAFPAGYRSSLGGFGARGEISSFWLPNEGELLETDGFAFELHFDENSLTGTEWSKYSGFSVRCLKD